jgi:hypothetical protein
MNQLRSLHEEKYRKPSESRRASYYGDGGGGGFDTMQLLLATGFAVTHRRWYWRLGEHEDQAKLTPTSGIPSCFYLLSGYATEHLIRTPTVTGARNDEYAHASSQGYIH